MQDVLPDVCPITQPRWRRKGALDSRCGEKDGEGATAGIAVDNGKTLGRTGPVVPPATGC